MAPRASSDTSQTTIRAPSLASVSATASPMPPAPAVITTLCPFRPPRNSSADFGALELMAFFPSIHVTLAKRHHRAEHHQSVEDRACRIGQRGAGEQHLECGEQQDASEHAKIVA